MNRNKRPFKANQSKRGKPPMNGPHVANTRGHISSPIVFQPLDHGHQQSDENPFSHLASEIEMDRPSANPFDRGIMPSFDDRAIDADYRNENAKKLSGRIRDDRKPQTKRPSTRDFLPPPLLSNNVMPPANRYPKDVETTAVPIRDPVHVKTIPDVQEELDLDDFLPKPPTIIPSIDLKPQINIRSRSTIERHVEVKPRINIPNLKPVATPISQPVIQSVAQPVAKPVATLLSKPVAEPIIRPFIAPITQTKPIIDYFGTTNSNESRQEADEKEEYFRESQLEANKILFGVEEPSRPLTNVEVSKRKKLILKLVDQKLKIKLSELMNKLGDRTKGDDFGIGNALDSRERDNDTFDDQMQNLVPDSVPDNAAHTQNWEPYPSEPTEQPWNNFAINEPNKEQQWPIRPPMYQPNPRWEGPPNMNPFPPGVDPMHNIHNIRYPGMTMRPQWNPNQWQPHLRPPEQQWQSQQQNWNMPVRPMNHLMQPNVNLLYSPDEQHPNPNYQFNDVLPGNRLNTEKPAAEIELELKEKEFLERMGSKKNTRREGDLDRHKRSPDKQRRRSRERSRRSRERVGSIRSRSRGDRSKHGSQDRQRDRSRRENDRIVHRGALSPSRLSPPVSPNQLFRSNSFEYEQVMLYEEMADEFQPPICELMEPMDRSCSRELRRSNSGEDLRVRLSQRRNKEIRSRSPADLRNKLLSDRSDSQKRHRNDSHNDLRNQLSSRKRSRSKSRSRSSRKTDKPDDAETEWIKFNNIVGMLMNIERDAELTSEEMTEKKEIMRLLLENPDLLELDNKFVYKFGKGRLNLAVKEAENILYPNGIPDERIASLISKKIATMSTESKKIASKQKESVPIEWIKLCSIIDQLLGLTVGVRKSLSATDKRMIERDELLLKVSEDPNSLLKLGTRYGHRNVEWAAKFAKKIIYRNGVRDRRVDETIAKEREKLLNNFKKAVQSRRSSESDTKSIYREWNQLSMHVTKLVESTLEKNERMSRADIRRRDDLLVQMSRDPDAIRSDTKFTDNIDRAILNDIIEKCKKLIASVKSNDDKKAIQEFERQRSKLMNFLKPKSTPTPARDQILNRISHIFAKDKKWKPEEKKERESLIEALIKDPESLKLDAKIIERIDEKQNVDEIIADIKKILARLDPSQAKTPKKFHISSSKVIDIPFVVKIEDASNQLNDTTKTVLLKALRDMITEIENPPKPKLLQQRYLDNRVEVVCANLLTFEWLKRAIASDFADKWSGADLKIERVPVVTKIPRDQLKPVVVVFKDYRATLPFDDLINEFKKENPKLYPERWQLMDARSKEGDYKKKTVGIDIESLAALEQMNRFARLGRSLVYFDICYMGNDVANFEATCQ